MSGGYDVTRMVSGLVVIGSYPRTSVGADDQGVIRVWNSGTADGRVRMFTVCADLR